MARITKVLPNRTEYRDTYAIVHVIVDDSDECSVFIGGEVETYFDDRHNRAKAWIKRPVDIAKHKEVK